ncbi:C6 finger domain-containing protein [Colletotrichum sojae]|uniref:C6 finger domain-containing protein n=1 Tax=Colletotrichum sojae TaxID=2175907 RepID=A0A8H6MTN3_9PEZI|nr:C6 finger domain-containing protein [Colletotrichum sojae]
MAHAQDSQEPHKRKRDADDSGSQPAHSDRIPQPPPPQSGNPSIINYLSKANPGRLKLIQGEPDTFSDVLGLLNQYEGVLNRHESLAANLGAKLTGPRLLKAMEGAFEGPIITNPQAAYGTASVSWLDIVTFAKTNPEKFVLTTGHDGERTCQFYLNGVQVQILEDDWRLIMNGALDRFSVVSTAPLEEDETAEVATLEIVEQRLQVLIKKADEIAKRARQLNYHLSGRKAAINSRHTGPPGGSSTFQSVNHSQRHVGHGSGYDLHADLLQQFLSSAQTYPPRVPSSAGLDPAHSGQRTPPAINPHPHSLPLQGRPPMAHAPVAAPHRDSSYDPSSAHRGVITARIEKLGKGDQIWPPCDRCRRLKSPCVKHLTACQGCTKKHAKCGWKTITDEEIAWLNREASSSADEAHMEPSPAQPMPTRTLRYDPTQDDGRSHDEPPPPSCANLAPGGETSRPASRGQQGHRQRSPLEPGSRSRTSSFMDLEQESPPNPKTWAPEPHRVELPGLKRDHLLLSHMASAATAAADARDANITTPATNVAGR